MSAQLFFHHQRRDLLARGDQDHAQRRGSGRRRGRRGRRVQQGRHAGGGREYQVSTVTRNVTLDTSVPVIKSATITPNPVDAGATMVIAVEIE